MKDDKDNLVSVTIFESMLSRFLIENPRFYKDIYIKILDEIEIFLNKNRTSPLDERHRFAIFSSFSLLHEGYKSFEDVKNKFDLIVADTLIKFFCENLLAYRDDDCLESIFAGKTNNKNTFFSFKKNDQIRKQKLGHLFSAKNRGVVELDSEDLFTRDLGIIQSEHTPESLKNYFSTPAESARFYYIPDENSFVARWLRKRHLPVIAGASSSCEKALTRALSLISLTDEDLRMFFLAQGASGIGRGHHSLFEYIIVGLSFGYKLVETDNLLDFYLQCIPKEIQEDETFQTFLQSEEICSLIKGIPLYSTSIEHTDLRQ